MILKISKAQINIVQDMITAGKWAGKDARTTRDIWKQLETLHDTLEGEADMGDLDITEAQKKIFRHFDTSFQRPIETEILLEGLFEQVAKR